VDPVRVAKDALVELHHLARVEAVQWWRRHGQKEGDRRDLYAAWLGIKSVSGEGPRKNHEMNHEMGALAWVELTASLRERDSDHDRDRREGALLRGWID
jgi:hypothetical protein